MVSQAIAGLRVGRGTVRRFRQSGAWGMQYTGLTGSGFHVVVHGQGWLVTPDQEPVALQAGDVVLITSGADHGISCTRRSFTGLPPMLTSLDPPDLGPADFEFLCGSYRLDQGQVHPYLGGMPDPIVISPDYEQHPHLRSVVDLLAADEVRDQPGDHVTRAALLDLVLVHVLRQWLEQTGAENRPTVTDPAIAEALQRIHDRPAAPWTVSRLSQDAGLSRSAFTRRFTTVVGQPPITYLIGWRLNCAARLLRETDASLAQIARRVGYSTEFAFAGAFRREYGLPPGRFRTADPGSASGLPTH